MTPEQLWSQVNEKCAEHGIYVGWASPIRRQESYHLMILAAHFDVWRDRRGMSFNDSCGYLNWVTREVIADSIANLAHFVARDFILKAADEKRHGRMEWRSDAEVQQGIDLHMNNLRSHNALSWDQSAIEETRQALADLYAERDYRKRQEAVA